MRVLVSVLGSRGDIQPLVALASRLRALGHETRMCTTPDFRDWIESLGISVVPIGSEVRWSGPGPTPQQRRQMILDTVAAQFATIPDAARGCDVVLGFGAMQFAARSAAEALGIPYAYAHYTPTALPSPHHAPVALPGWPQDQSDDNRQRWAADAQRWNDTCGAAVNAHRATAGLPPVHDIRGHMLTERPWLAADAVLGPWPEADDPHVLQTGAWFERDERPLPAEVEEFLAAGDPPIYFGLGSTRLPGENFGQAAVTAARALDRRTILSHGWSDVSLPDEGCDCLLIEEANLQALFRRVAAAVHHGGSGTTTIAARAGIPQIIIPQRYDQYYWADRIDRLGVGVAHPTGTPTADSLAATIGRALAPGVTSRAHVVSGQVRDDGAQTAAELLTTSQRRSEATAS